MKDKQLVDFTSLLIWTAIVLIRRNFGGRAFFPGEFLIEDLLLLLMVALVSFPAKFRPLLLSLVSCSICISMVYMASSQHLLLITVFSALFGIYGAVRAAIEASKLWRNRNGLQ